MQAHRAYLFVSDKDNELRVAIILNLGQRGDSLLRDAATIAALALACPHYQQQRPVVLALLLMLQRRGRREEAPRK